MYIYICIYPYVYRIYLTYFSAHGRRRPPFRRRSFQLHARRILDDRPALPSAGRLAASPHWHHARGPPHRLHHPPLPRARGDGGGAIYIYIYLQYVSIYISVYAALARRTWPTTSTARFLTTTRERRRRRCAI